MASASNDRPDGGHVVIDLVEEFAERLGAMASAAIGEA
jgi:hypothetical protein